MPEDSAAGCNGELARRTGSAVVQLNQAAALAEPGDLEAGLALADRVELYHCPHATRSAGSTAPTTPA